MAGRVFLVNTSSRRQAKPSKQAARPRGRDPFPGPAPLSRPQPPGAQRRDGAAGGKSAARAVRSALVLVPRAPRGPESARAPGSSAEPDSEQQYFLSALVFGRTFPRLAEVAVAQSLPLLSGLEVVAGPAHPSEAAPEEGALEEEAPPMPQDNDPEAPQALDSTDLDVPTEAVTCQPQGNPLGCTPLLPNGSGHTSELDDTRCAGNGALRGPKATRKLQAHPSLASQGSKKSKSSSKSAASQIPLQAQEDCCVHCILSCLFCEFLALCNLVLDCATCGSCSSEDSCLCCCCCGSGECAD
ncbi:myoD family inhibitor, partial [Echinops telfairi]|uniref:MyoD family inhibitor n=1 Tax=Echinops telfairi TaxID=9371 RepID=A0AC55DG26_ECHTE